MEFILIDLYDTKIQNNDFIVVALYELKSHQTTKVYFKSDEKAKNKLQDFFNKNAYNVVSNHVTYEMKNNGKISLKLSI